MACIRLAESAAEFFPDALHRDGLSPSTSCRSPGDLQPRALNEGARDRDASDDIVAAREKAVRVIDKLRTLRLTKSAELAEGAVGETLAYYQFPEEHWRRIRTTDGIDKSFLFSLLRSAILEEHG